MSTNFADGVNHVSGLLTKTIDQWLHQLVILVPNIVVGLVVILLVYVLSLVIAKAAQRYFTVTDRQNLGEILGRFIKFVTNLFGLALAITIIAPSMNVSDLIAGMGVGSVAIGFAFKDILQNWFAGLLILFKQPFRVGDSVQVNNLEGTIQKVDSRSTVIKTYDGQKVLIPNNIIYTSPLTIRNAYAMRRSEYDIGIGYGDDIKRAIAVINDVLANIDGITKDKEPEVLVSDLAASWVTLKVRWWTDTDNGGSIIKNRSQFIESIKYRFDEEGIDMPYQTFVHLHHDQTEDADKQRSTQREGWPA